MTTSKITVSVSAQSPPPVSFQATGAWNDPVNYPIYGPPAYPAVGGDFNGDGKLDVLRGDYRSINVLKLMGNASQKGSGLDRVSRMDLAAFTTHSLL